MLKRNILTTALLSAGAAILATAPAHAGLLDGTLDNAHIIDQLSALNTNINSDPQTTENNNANTRADGKLTNAIGQHQ
ncbi:hypothetical protein [Streptomyces sp. AC550_RSS872]|uniref:hypothetical protein n=1 Tax=Streptomyces sp. AC550_RSS872 TaxID=2823689 RepID=UPI001C278E96|nr:hypothetical protein [Streptomyces sp. AC550_RSS872]